MSYRTFTLHAVLLNGRNKAVRCIWSEVWLELRLISYSIYLRWSLEDSFVSFSWRLLSFESSISHFTRWEFVLKWLWWHLVLPISDTTSVWGVMITGHTLRSTPPAPAAHFLTAQCSLLIFSLGSMERPPNMFSQPVCDIITSQKHLINTVLGWGRVWESLWPPLHPSRHCL